MKFKLKNIKYATVADIAKKNGVSGTAIKKQIYKGKREAIKIGRMWLIKI